jgi:hypothetical protein
MCHAKRSYLESSSLAGYGLISLTQSRREDTSVNTGRPLSASSSRYCSRSVDNLRARQMASYQSAVSRHRRRSYSGIPFLFLPVRCEYFEENTPASWVRCSRRRLRSLSALNPCHNLAAMLACRLNDRYLSAVSVVARANSGIGERAGGSRLLDLQRRGARRRHMFSADP